MSAVNVGMALPMRWVVQQALVNGQNVQASLAEKQAKADRKLRGVARASKYKDGQSVMDRILAVLARCSVTLRELYAELPDVTPKTIRSRMYDLTSNDLATYSGNKRSYVYQLTKKGKQHVKDKKN